MEMEEKDWTLNGIRDALDTGERELLERIDSEPLPDDEDAALAKTDYEEGPLEQVRDLSNFEYCFISAALHEDEETVLTMTNNCIFDFDAGDSHRENRLADEDAWKDKPYGETIPAPAASALKLGSEGMHMSWASKLLWLMVILVLNWIAWNIMS